MSRESLKARVKTTGKMTRDGYITQNAVTGEKSKVSKREQDFNLLGDGQDVKQTVKQPHKKQNAPLNIKKTRRRTAFQKQNAEKTADKTNRSPDTQSGLSQPYPQNNAPVKVITGVKSSGYDKAVSPLEQSDIQMAENQAAPEITQNNSAKSQRKWRGNKRGKTTRRSDMSQSGNEKTLVKTSKVNNAAAPDQSKIIPSNRDNPADPARSSVVNTSADSHPNNLSEKPADLQFDKHGGKLKNKSGKLKFNTDEAAVNTKTSNKSSQNRKLIKAQRKLDIANKKLEKARNSLPTKKRIRSKYVIDEKSGKGKIKLRFENEVVPQSEHIKGALPLRPVKAASNSAIAFGHRKIFQVEKENVGTEAAHKGELTMEGGLRKAYRLHKTAPYREVTKLERAAAKRSVKLSYQKALAENPKIRGNMLSRMWQKRKIKKDYAKVAREAKKTAERVKAAGSFTANVGKVVAGIIKRHPIMAVVILLLLLAVIFLTSLFGLAGSAGSGGFGAIAAGSYLAGDMDINNAELAYTEWEADLQSQIASAEIDHPGYDAYQYNIGCISHDPYELMAYLTAVYQDFTYGDIVGGLHSLFSDQYLLSYTESWEAYYADPQDLNQDGDLEPYYRHVLTVTLSAKSFTDVIYSHMNAEQRQSYDILTQTKGSRQYIDSPFDFGWLPYVTDNYGWYYNTGTNMKEYNSGMGISAPAGSKVYAGLDGLISLGYDTEGRKANSVTITGNNNLMAKYENLDSVMVNDNQIIKTGELIATAGSSEVRLEITKDGQDLNPLYFAVTDDSDSEISYGDPGAPMGDGSYAALIAEAEKYLGYPYVWSGSNPGTSFDCSGYVCWVLNHSGAANVGRTTAQGLYNLCAPVSREDARPGDLVFFTKTYSSSNPVTHVGIYVGYVDGRPTMINAGDPIQYSYLDSQYNIDHLYGYGRISGTN